MVIHIFVIFSVDHPSFLDPVKLSLHIATAILAVRNMLGDVPIPGYSEENKHKNIRM